MNVKSIPSSNWFRIIPRVSNVAIATLVLLPMLATAGLDGKSYPAWLCKAKNGNDAQNLLYQSDGGVSNRDTSSVYIVCPILRDQIIYNGSQQLYSRGIQTTSVFYTDNHSVDRVECTTRSISSRGVKSITRANSPRGIQRRGSLHSNGPSQIMGLATRGHGFYHMICKLPGRTNQGRSILHSYYAEEFTD